MVYVLTRWAAAVAAWIGPWTDSAAFAYETDQLTDRAIPLHDAAPAANRWMDAVMADAIAETNQATRCARPPAPTRATLAREIAERAHRRVIVPDRGALRAFGYSALGAWLETTPDVERHEFVDRRDLYHEARFTDSAILRHAGPCSTIRIATELVGTDKLDHFVGTGYATYRKSRRGDDLDRGLRWGRAPSARSSGCGRRRRSATPTSPPTPPVPRSTRGCSSPGASPRSGRTAA
jgi:hypothetical protein